MEHFLTWIILLITCKLPYVASTECIENGKQVCCSGYKRNKTSGQCESCQPGYTGMECMYPCIYPSFGVSCSMECICNEDLCNFAFGCSYISTSASISVEYKTSQPRKLQASTIWRFKKADTERQSFDVQTEVSPAPDTSTQYVFYTTIALISVFVSSFLVYGLSYLGKLFNSKQRTKTADRQTKDNGDSLYECVISPNYM